MNYWRGGYSCLGHTEIYTVYSVIGPPRTVQTNLTNQWLRGPVGTYAHSAKPFRENGRRKRRPDSIIYKRYPSTIDGRYLFAQSFTAMPLRKKAWAFCHESVDHWLPASPSRRYGYGGLSEELYPSSWTLPLAAVMVQNIRDCSFHDALYGEKLSE